MQNREGIVLPADDTYFLSIRGIGSFTGAFQFQIHEIPELTVRTIQLDEFIGDPALDAINVPGERNLYQFQGTAGQQIFFDAIRGNRFGINRILTNPSGATLLSGGIQDASEITLTETGQYDLLIDGLEDESFLVREVAAKTLGKIGSKKALGSLRKVAAGDSHEPVRRAAKEALLRINNINNGSGKGRSRRF